MTALAAALPARDEVIVRLMALLDLAGVGPANVNRLRGLAGSTAVLIQAVEEGAPPESPLAVDKLFGRVRDQWARVRLGRYRDLLGETTDAGHHVVLADDPDYPRNLVGVSTAAPILYVWGSLERLDPRALALVGSVEPTKRGIARAHKMARLCTAHRIQVISGLARGIDTAAHEGALKSGAPTFAVVGHGLRYLYPPENKGLAERITEQGAVISQFPPGVRPDRWTFPMRNELMCTIAKGTVIVEVEQGEKFGSVIQARFSIKHGRSVFILHSNLTELESPVATELVQSGQAVDVQGFDDVLNTLEKSSQTFAPGAAAADLFAPPTEGIEAEQETAGPCAILFDVDGVIHDARDVMKRAYIEAIRSVSKLKVRDEEIDVVVGYPPPKVYAKFGVSFTAANAAYNRAYSRLVRDTECVFKPVVAFLRRARKAGFKVGIVTSQPRGRVQQVLVRAGIERDLDVSITWNDVPKGRTKPDPFGLQQALAVLQVPPERAMYVGDMPSDLLAARNARMRCVAVGWGLGREADLMRYSPDLFVSDFGELDALLDLCPGSKAASRRERIGGA